MAWLKGRNRTMLDIQSMMSFKELPLSFWGYFLEMIASGYQRGELLLDESSEAPQSNAGTSSAPTISTDHVPVLRGSARMPQPPAIYGFLALSVTSKYQACAREAHWSVVRIILKYLKRTKDKFLVYDSREFILEGYSDPSFQSDDDDAKSQSGFVFKLNDDVVA
ncbi:hypothetical protein Sango_2750400 [Sesamum angolense]|uniref:Retrovirus-related Pol polyprotein from transposon TNT 1-94 n=1 Tax=Sesamum angolense TaxID=2727404 RepID=A0AAE1T9S5_9LAMI|nr:hypothetical protein Sango_2750400 [Sesamum angolense]